MGKTVDSTVLGSIIIFVIAAVFSTIVMIIREKIKSRFRAVENDDNNK